MKKIINKRNHVGERNPFYEKHHTKEARQKISQARKNTILSQKTKQKISQSLLEHIVSEKTRQKISISNKNKIRSDETRKKISKVRMDRKHTEKTKQKMSGSHKGEKNPNWKNGISPITNLRLANSNWKKLAKRIRERDNYMCLYCKTEIANNVHHMLPVRLGGNDDEYNLITLCDRCHKFIEQKIIA